MNERPIRFARSPDGTRIAFSSTGGGSLSLVRAAHWLGSLDFDAQTPVWGPWIDALARRHRLTQYDSRGCGLSDRDVDSLMLDELVDDLARGLHCWACRRAARCRSPTRLATRNG